MGSPGSVQFNKRKKCITLNLPNIQSSKVDTKTKENKMEREREKSVAIKTTSSNMPAKTSPHK